MLKWEKIVVLFVLNIENVKTLNIMFLKKKKKKNISFMCSKCCNKDKKTFKEEESIEI